MLTGLTVNLYAILGALKTRSKKSTNVDVLAKRISNLEDKSSKLANENKQLKSEKERLQQQVQDLLAVLSQAKAGESVEDIHKRFKISEYEEKLPENPDFVDSGMKSPNISGSFLCEGEESEFMSSGEDELSAFKTENWFNQNDILNQVSENSPTKRVIHSTKDVDASFNSTHKENLSFENAERLVLDRNDQRESIFGNYFGEGVQNMFEQASMLTLTIVMCLVL